MEKNTSRKVYKMEIKEIIGISLFIIGAVLVAVMFLVEIEPAPFFALVVGAVISITLSTFLTKKFRGYILGLIDAFISSTW